MKMYAKVQTLTKMKGIDMSETSIGCTHQLKKKLLEFKRYPKHSFENIIWDLINGNNTPLTGNQNGTGQIHKK